MAFFKRRGRKQDTTTQEEEVTSPSPPASPKQLSLSGSTNMDAPATFEEQEEQNLEDRKRLWTRISGMVGKDIASLVSLPVTFFEPISVLQSMCEPLRNVSIIEKISTTEDPIDRICLVSAFCVGLFSHYTRTNKPFNPVLGETFEFSPANGAYRVLAEQVSHHPPVAVVQTTAADWSLSQESRIETKFWGTSVDANSVGNNILRFANRNEEFTWKNPCATIHNILLGRLWIEYHGQLQVRNLTTGDTCNLNFKKSGWFNSSRFEISGEARDKDGNIKAVMMGKWTEFFAVARVDEKGNKGNFVELWRRNIPESERQHRWKWDSFVPELTVMTEELENILPSTDSRLRGDLKALSALDMKLAGKEKTRIEERERQKRKDRESQGKKWSPVHFKKVMTPGEKMDYRWEYCGNYWEDKERRIESYKLKCAASEKSKDIKDLPRGADISASPTVIEG